MNQECYLMVHMGEAVTDISCYRRDKESIAKAMRSRGAPERRALTGEAGNASRRRVDCGSHTAYAAQNGPRRGGRKTIGAYFQSRHAN